MSEFLIFYLGIGLLFCIESASRGVFDLSKHAVTYLRSGDKPAVTKETRNIPEVVVTFLFTLLLWFIPVIFKLIYVPIHDYFAGKAWKKYLAEHPEYPRGRS